MEHPSPCEIGAGEAPHLPAYLLSLDLGLVLVTYRVLVVLAVLQVVLGTCRRVVFSMGSLVGLVVDTLHKNMLSKRRAGLNRAA